MLLLRGKSTYPGCSDFPGQLWVLIAIALIGIAVAIHARLDDWKRGQR